MTDNAVQWLVGWSRTDPDTGQVVAQGLIDCVSEESAKAVERDMRARGYRAEAYGAETLPGL